MTDTVMHSVVCPMQERREQLRELTDEVRANVARAMGAGLNYREALRTVAGPLTQARNIRRTLEAETAAIVEAERLMRLHSAYRIGTQLAALELS